MEITIRGTDQTNKPLTLGNITFDLSKLVLVVKKNKTFQAKLTKNSVCDQLILSFCISITEKEEELIPDWGEGQMVSTI